MLGALGRGDELNVLSASPIPLFFVFCFSIHLLPFLVRNNNVYIFIRTCVYSHSPITQVDVVENIAHMIDSNALSYP